MANLGWLGAPAVALLTSCLVTPSMASEATPRLVLQITVDGLRGDLLSRYGERFGPGGFRFLLDSGVVYTNAHYARADTETIVGHTTLATGAHPSRHGMVGNVWYDRESGELAYNIEDPDHALLPTREEAAAGAQVDPAQQRSRTSGRSPVSILASTFGDELWIHTGGRSMSRRRWQRCSGSSHRPRRAVRPWWKSWTRVRGPGIGHEAA